MADVTISATAGTTYYIAVDGYNGGSAAEWGDVVLSCADIGGGGTLPPGATALLDFVNGTYQYGGTGYTSLDVLDHPEYVIPDVGLVINAAEELYQAALISSPFRDFVLSGNWTIVVEWFGSGCPLNIYKSGAPASHEAVFQSFRSEDYFIFDWLATVERDIFFGLWSEHIHCGAWTRTDARMAASIDGVAVVTEEDSNETFAAAGLDTVEIGADSGDPSMVIGRVVFYATQGDSNLPGLAASSVLSYVSNDNFADAITINVGDVLTGNNFIASSESGEPHIGFSQSGGHSVWWKYTAAVSGTRTISLVGSDSNDYGWTIGVYTGSAVNALTEILYVQDWPLPADQTFSATAGTTYYIQIDGWGRGGTGQIQIALT